jgi:phage-related protein
MMDWQVEYYKKENGSHGFTKKTEKTPQRELERALRYKEDFERRCNDE